MSVKVIPEDMANLKRLRKLCLYGNPLVAPYSSIREVHGDAEVLEMLRSDICTVDLGNLGLTEVPIDFMLRKASLRIVELYGNYITDIPKDILKVKTCLQTPTAELLHFCKREILAPDCLLQSCFPVYQLSVELTNFFFGLI